MSKFKELNSYERDIIGKWLNSFKKSTTIYLILTALRSKEMWSKELDEYMNEKVGSIISIDERSLYRALRRLNDIDLVTFQEVDADKTGANRKVYSLTESGRRLQVEMDKVYKSL